MRKAELEQLKLSELRNLLLEEMRYFIAALDTESSTQLQERKNRIRLIEEVLDSKNSLQNKKSTLKES